jgi:hypothetical protein
MNDDRKYMYMDFAVFGVNGWERVYGRYECDQAKKPYSMNFRAMPALLHGCIISPPLPTPQTRPHELYHPY